MPPVILSFEAKGQDEATQATQQVRQSLDQLNQTNDAFRTYAEASAKAWAATNAELARSDPPLQQVNKATLQVETALAAFTVRAVQAADDSKQLGILVNQAEVSIAKLGVTTQGQATDALARFGSELASEKERLAALQQAQDAAHESGQHLHEGWGEMLKMGAQLALGFSTVEGALHLVKHAFTEGLEEAGKFQVSLVHIEEIGHLSHAQLDQVRTDLLAINPALGSSTELAEAYVNALRTTGDGAAALNQVSQAAILAKATGSDLDSATKLLTQSTVGFGLSGKDAADIADIMTVAWKNSTGTLASFGQALAQVGPFAQGLKLGLDDVSATLAGLSDVMKSPQAAAFALSQVLRALTQNQAELALMGIHVKDILASGGGLTGVLQALAPVVAANEDALKKLGIEGRSWGAVLELLGPQAQRVGDIHEQLTHRTGAAAEAQKAISKTYADAVKQLGAAWTDFTNVAIGPGLSALAAVIQKMVEGINEIKRWKEEFDKANAAEAENLRKNTAAWTEWGRNILAQVGLAERVVPALANSLEQLKTGVGLTTLQADATRAYDDALAEEANKLVGLTAAQAANNASVKQANEDIKIIQTSIEHLKQTSDNLHILPIATVRTELQEALNALQRLSTNANVTAVDFATEVQQVAQLFFQRLGTLPPAVQTAIRDAYAHLERDTTDATSKVQASARGLGTFVTGVFGEIPATILPAYTRLVDGATAAGGSMKLALSGAAQGVVQAWEVSNLRLVDSIKVTVDGKIIPTFSLIGPAAARSLDPIPAAWAKTGLQTQAALQQTAVDALAVFQGMVESGRYAPAQLADFWVKNVKLIDSAGFQSLPPAAQAMAAKILIIAQQYGLKIPEPLISAGQQIVRGFDLQAAAAEKMAVQVAAAHVRMAQAAVDASRAAVAAGQAGAQAELDANIARLHAAENAEDTAKRKAAASQQVVDADGKEKNSIAAGQQAEIDYWNNAAQAAEDAAKRKARALADADAQIKANAEAEAASFTKLATAASGMVQAVNLVSVEFADVNVAFGNTREELTKQLSVWQEWNTFLHSSSEIAADVATSFGSLFTWEQYLTQETQAYAEAVDILNAKLLRLAAQGTETSNYLQAAYDILGAHSSQALKQMADAAVQAFQIAERSGTSTAEHLRDIWVSDVLPKITDAYGTIPEKFRDLDRQIEGDVQHTANVVIGSVTDTANVALDVVQQTASKALTTVQQVQQAAQSAFTPYQVGTQYPTGSSPGYVPQSPITTTTRIPTYDIGTPYVPYDQLAYLHQGERVVPAAQNTPTAQPGRDVAGPLSIQVGGVTANITLVGTYETLEEQFANLPRILAQHIARVLTPAINEGIARGDIKGKVRER